jgi:hypothetical protein
MQTRHKQARVVKRVTEAWQKRPPYVFTKIVFVTGGTIFALLAVRCVLTTYNAEQFVVYAMGSMIFFLWRYALTHL